MSDLESATCPLCASTTAKALYEGRFAPYGLMSCQACGLGYLSPRLTEAAMLAHYANDQYFSGDQHGYNNYAAQAPALRATFRRLLQTLAKQGRTGGSLLEIGCGFGYLLHEAQPYFTRRVGTDFSAEAVRTAQTHADAVYAGGVAAVPSGELFDCIIATHVIEHTYHPREFIRDLLLHLRPGGSLIIAAPDAGSFWRKLMGYRWPSFKLPEHVLYFDQCTLHRLLAECGLETLQTVPYPHAFPLPLIAAKLGLTLPASLGRHALWLPKTTIAIAGVKPSV
ncbi:hypothetical protein GCM10007907_28160 [Chitinimonas prasina]|uniref:Class I SAM-dependent methyltransferase n=1 Tax=Chitinimonas prasina TaxID=1434937 RepID=A0ABQ5YL94_9NEIS|nr:class I SAM-dependent methyltransferase [Chitinimonas prasina]GLR14026.1 hypothetical protein GCM10007907_28160 [Chitinimonas prasina]